MTKKNKNLLVITNVYPLPNSPNRGIYNKIQTDLLAKEYNVRILVPIVFTEWFKNRSSANKAIRYVWQFYIPIIGTPINGFLLFLSLYINSYTWIKKFSPDLILTCWSYPDGVAGYLLSKIFKVPFFLKVHGSDVNIHCNYASRRKQIAWIANKAVKVFCVSKALQQKLIDIGVNKERTAVVYNGVNSDIFKPSDGEKKDQIVFVGNLKRSKGIYEALEGFDLIAEKFPEYKLIYIGGGTIGGGSEDKELQQKVDELNLTDKVLLVGSKSHQEIARIIQQSKLLLLPSHAEGVPNVILEAMSAGVPSVATAVGGIPEIIVEGKNGFLAKEIDGAQVAEALTKALNHEWDAELITNMSKNYNWHKNVEQLKFNFQSIK